MKKFYLIYKAFYKNTWSFSALILNSCLKKQEFDEGNMGCGLPALDIKTSG